MDSFFLIIAVVSAYVIFVVLLRLLITKTGFTGYESGEKRAGHQGEQFATQIIKEILNEKDVLLTNVKVSFDGKETELDNVVINNRGVFIIEVKNYSGELLGDEDDYEWIKNKYTNAGNFYSKIVKNPIKQVKRQIYILSGHLKQYGINVWVEGYVFLVESNSPVESRYIVVSQKDIHFAIHQSINNKLTNDNKNKIVELLSE